MKNNNNPKGVSEKFTPFKLKRKCISCHKILPREKLVRILKEHKTQQLIISPDNKIFGRSAYICYNNECLKVAIKKNRLKKALKAEINETLINKLKIMIK